MSKKQHCPALENLYITALTHRKTQKSFLFKQACSSVWRSDLWFQKFAPRRRGMKTRCRSPQGFLAQTTSHPVAPQGALTFLQDISAGWTDVLPSLLLWMFLNFLRDWPTGGTWLPALLFLWIFLKSSSTELRYSTGCIFFYCCHLSALNECWII